MNGGPGDGSLKDFAASTHSPLVTLALFFLPHYDLICNM